MIRTPAQRALARSQAFQLLAMAFSHPVPELHTQLVDGRFCDAVDDALETAYGQGIGLPAVCTDFATFESQYIELFAVGHRGRPAVPLCAGEYLDLLDGMPRPTLLLRYSQFYQHFGVRARDRGDDGELPDHITCQLQFLAWLTHLEAGAVQNRKDVEGYQRAQRDFVGRLMAGFCEGLSRRLTVECGKRACDPFFASLGLGLGEFVNRNRVELESMHGAINTPIETRPTAASAAQNLWG